MTWVRQCDFCKEKYPRDTTLITISYPKDVYSMVEREVCSPQCGIGFFMASEGLPGQTVDSSPITGQYDDPSAWHFTDLGEAPSLLPFPGQSGTLSLKPKKRKKKKSGSDF